MKSYAYVGAVAAAALGSHVKAEEEKCYMSLDVMFLQDSTGSFEDDLPNVMKQLPTMVKDILKSNPNSLFGVAEFKDKPYYPLGEESDFCYKLDGGLSSNVDEFCSNYGNIYASGGGDLPEATFQALIDIAYDRKIGWRPIVSKSEAPEHAGAHVVIISTDAVPHIAGDIDKLRPTFADLPKLPDNPGTAENNDFVELCEKYKYPDANQVKAALELEDIYLVILTPDDPKQPEVVSTWKWVNEELLQQPADFYQIIDADSKDLLKGVLAALESVTETACAQTTTTSSPTTTTSSPTTTTKSPTTTTKSPTTTTKSQTTTTKSPTTTTKSPTTTTKSPTTTTKSPTTTITKCPPCAEDNKPCCPALEIRVGENPKALVVDYES